MIDPSPSNARVRAVAAMLGIAIVAWWCWLLAMPDHRAWFRPSSWPDASLLAFALPDLILAALLLALAGGARATWLWAAVIGGYAYATAYCLGVVLLTGEAELALLAMFAGFCVLGAAAGADLRIVRSQPHPLVRTLLIMLVFWVMFLAIVPGLIARAEDRVGIGRFAFAGHWIAGALVFACSSLLGVWSALVMARAGGGTPLPIDAASQLVIDGPYRFVRNPMAIAGLAQAVGVAIAIGSWMTFVYVLIGAAIWQWVVRPGEEAQLLRQFGEPYATYRKAVRCWIPRALSTSRVSDNRKVQHPAGTNLPTG